MPRLAVTTTAAAVQAAICGVGVTRLLHYQVAAGMLMIVLGEFEPDPAPVNLVHASLGAMPLKMRRFPDFAVPRLRVAVAQVGGDGLWM